MSLPVVGPSCFWMGSKGRTAAKVVAARVQSVSNKLRERMNEMSVLKRVRVVYEEADSPGKSSS